MDELIAPLLVLMRGLHSQARARWAHRRDDGVSTLEMVIIAVGLMAVAAVLVAVITAAVNRRTSQIK